MTDRLGVELIDRLAVLLPDLLADARRLAAPRPRRRARGGDGGEGRLRRTAPAGARERRRLGLGIRVLAGTAWWPRAGVGLTLGTADTTATRIVREAIAQASPARRGQRRAEGAGPGEVRGPRPPLADTRLCPVEVRRDTGPAVFEIDPRRVALDEMAHYTLDIARQVQALDPRLTYSYLSTLTQLSRELLASTEGALIDQSFALTQGFAFVVAASRGVSQELGDVLGHQRGWETVLRGVDDPLLAYPPFAEFAPGPGRESSALVEAPSAHLRRRGRHRHGSHQQHPALPRDHRPSGRASIAP
jgi:TldD protein